MNTDTEWTAIIGGWVFIVLYLVFDSFAMLLSAAILFTSSVYSSYKRSNQSKTDKPEAKLG